jgi:hypothetical protein
MHNCRAEISGRSPNVSSFEIIVIDLTLREEA